jgi:DNA-binding response OmpR family regulator
LYVTSSLGRRAKLKNKRVLVVEDEALVSMLVEDELRDAGAEVLGPAASLGEALRLVEAVAADGGMDAAVLDVNLNGRHVAPVADKLAALGVPFLFATGYGDTCDTGGHETAPRLQKPFAPENLIAAVHALTSANAARDWADHGQTWHGRRAGVPDLGRGRGRSRNGVRR